MVTSTCGVQGLQEAAQAVVLPSVEAAAAAAKYPAGRVCPRDPGGAARRSLVLEVRRRQRVHELGRQGGAGERSAVQDRYDEGEPTEIRKRRQGGTVKKKQIKKRRRMEWIH